MDQPKINWKKNLAVVWVSQFLSLSGFLFFMPFVPFYLKELGVTDTDTLYLYSALFVSAAPFSFMIMGPVWGKLSDKYGRKPMMLRAYFAASVVLFCMGSVKYLGELTGLSPVFLLLTLRVLQGVFTGTVPAAQALIATSTPEQRQGLALGTLAAGVHSGVAAGCFFGGLLAAKYGAATSGKVAGGIMLVAALLVLFGVREDFEAPEQDVKLVVKKKWKMPDLGPGLPLLILMGCIALALNLVRPIMPLFVQELTLGHDKQQAMLTTGYMGGVAAIALAFSGVMIGWISDRVKPQHIGRISAVMSGIFCILISISLTIPKMYVYRTAMMFCIGGLDPSFQAWLSRVTTKEKRGSVFGWAITFRSLGWCIAPQCGALIASYYGDLRIPFFVQGLLLISIIPMIGWAARKMVTRDDVVSLDQNSSSS